MERHFLHTTKTHQEEISDSSYCATCDDRSVEIAQKLTGLKKGAFAAIVAVLGCVILCTAAAETVYCGSESAGRQSEARTILTRIYEAEMAYFSTENTFSDDTAAIGFETAAPPRYYQWKIEVYDCGEFGPVHYRVWVWGNIDGDETLDIWEGGDDIESVNISNDTEH